MVVVRKADAAGGPRCSVQGGRASGPARPGEVLVRHAAIGVNFVDTYYRSGLYPCSDCCLIPGNEAAGSWRRSEEALNISRWETGSSIHPPPVLTGPNVRWMLVRIPDGIDDVTAAAVFLKGLTVRYLVTDSYLVSSGEFALVHAAASRVGLLLGQWRASLAAVAIGVAGGPEKAALAAHHGYAHVIDYNSDDIVANVTRLTGVPLCAAAYDSVGRTTWRVSLACLRTRGTFVSFGQSSGPVTDFRVSDLARGAFMGHPAKAFRFYSRTAGIAAEISGTVREDPGWCSEGGCRDTASAL